MAIVEVFTKTDRLLLRLIQVTDAVQFYQMTNDPSIKQYVPYVHQSSVEETGVQILRYKQENGIYNFNLIIEEKSTHKMVGAILASANIISPLDLDVSILTEASSRKKGYMKEALAAFVNALPPSTTLSFRIDRSNEASLRTVSQLEGI